MPAGKNWKRRRCLRGSSSLPSFCADSHRTYALNWKNSKDGHFLLWLLPIMSISHYRYLYLKSAQRCAQQEEVGLSCRQGSRQAQNFSCTVIINHYSGFWAVLASLASTNTKISYYMHLVPVLFFYGGGEGLRILATFKTSNRGHFPPWLFPIMLYTYTGN